LPSNDRGTHIDKDWWEGFKKYAVEMGSGAMIYIPSFYKDWLRYSKINKGGYTDTQAP
jgi:hypothetical protein